jgi:hypothetical protein
MVNLLVSVLLSGLAVTFAIEFLYLVIGFFLDKDITYNFLTLPLSFGALLCLANISKLFLVTVPATAFIVLFINKYINKQSVYNIPRRQLPRL